MAISFKTRQVAGVALIVGLTVVAMSVINLAWTARFLLTESASRGELLALTTLQVAHAAAGGDPRVSLPADPGVRAILESGLAFSPDVTYVAITDTSNVAVVHSSPDLEGHRVADESLIKALLAQGPVAHLRAIYSERTFEVRERLLLGDQDFGVVRVGLSMLLVRDELNEVLAPAVLVTAAALAIALVGSSLFAQWVLRPIHVLRSGLTRLGRGEFDVSLDLPPDTEFGDIGRSFKGVSGELAAARSQMAGQARQAESVVDRLEDAVAMIGPRGDLLFANASMRSLVPDLETGAPFLERLPAGHPFAEPFRVAFDSGRTQGPVRVDVPDGQTRTGHLVAVHVIEGSDRQPVGVMVVARNLSYVDEVESTLKYSRKLASLGRLLAGVAHEVKNPLNAMTIHLALLKQKLDAVSGRAEKPAPDRPGLVQHAEVIEREIRRLDEVVQGFIKFSRPEDLTLAPVSLCELVEDVRGVIGPEAAARSVAVRNECAPDVPPVRGDRAMLHQALLNLGLNACQAMPEGGALRFSARTLGRQSVELSVADTGGGIAPEHLGRIFNLYFTTREGGSGIGLSLVYRTVQLHDGSIEVESTPGRGTTFRLVLPRAS